MATEAFQAAGIGAGRGHRRRPRRRCGDVPRGGRRGGYGIPRTQPAATKQRLQHAATKMTKMTDQMTALR